MMQRWEHEAANFLASQLAAANVAEFLHRVALVLDEHHLDLLTATEAISQIRQLRASLASSNRKLRSLVPDGGSPPGAAGDPFIPWTHL